MTEFTVSEQHDDNDFRADDATGVGESADAVGPAETTDDPFAAPSEAGSQVAP